ncbi:MAG: tetratricopeptide repeat protein [Pseudomonadales bacterium]|nr:tetratricopeptide repeat protein [Pseudomonadales bacterium]
MADVFISYAREDRPKIEPFVALLESQGWSVWWDREVVPGHSFGSVIEKQIDDAACVVVFWTRHSVDSNWVHVEANEGLERGILVPILLDDVRVPLVFRRTESVSLSGWPEHEDSAELERILKAIGHLIGSSVDGLKLDHERPRGRRLRVVFALSVLVTVAAALTVYLTRDDAPMTPTTTLAVEEIPAASITVMPFTGMGTEIAPELARLLSRSGEFFVQNVEQVQAHISNPDQVSLEARYSLQGSVTGDRLTVSLFDRERGETRWDESIVLEDYSLPELTQFIVTRVSNVFNAPSISLDNVSHDAYLTYLQGKAKLKEQSEMASLKQAESLFLETVERAPRFGEGYAGLCETYTFMYMESKAVEYFEEAERRCFRASTLSGDNLQVQIALGRLYRIAGSYELALEHLMTAQKSSPFSMEALREMALVKYEQNDVEEATALLKLVQTREPNYWKNYEELATVYFQTGQFLKAAGQYERMRQLVRNESRVLNDLGGAYFLAEQFDQAVDTWQASLSESPTAPALSNLGSAYFYNGEFEEAADAYREAIELRSEDARLWVNAGEAIMQTGNDARRYFEKAVELASKQLAINPDDAGLLSLLGSSYAALDRRDESLRFVNQALSQSPDDVHVLYGAAVAFSRLDEVQRRDAILERMMEQGYSKTLIERDANFKARRKQ